MRGRKKACDCNVCRYTQEPVDSRKIARHRQKYGKFVQKRYTEMSSPRENETQPMSTLPIDFDGVDSDSNSRSSFFRSELPLQKLNTDGDNTENVREEKNLMIMKLSNDEFSATTGLSDDLHSLSDQTSSSDDTDKDSETNSGSFSEDEEFSSDLHSSTSDWSCVYAESLYECDLTKKYVPNTSMTLLHWLCLQFHLLVSHPTLSNNAFMHNLQILKSIHNDTDNVLPASYTEAKKLIDPFLIKKMVFSVCPNECVIFWDSAKYTYANLDKCPVCHEERFLKSAANRQIPRRKFFYIPIGPRIARIFGNVNLCQLVQSHPGNQCGEDIDDMWDVHHTSTWRELYSGEGFFRGEKKGISYAFELDGVNPFHNIGVQYSMTPIMLTLLNLLRHVRNSFQNINLVGIVPGNRSRYAESSNLDPYLEILVDELLFLSQCTMHTYENAPIDIKIKLQMYVLDYPGLSKVFQQHGSGSLSGCHWCHIVGKKM